MQERPQYAVGEAVVIFLVVVVAEVRHHIADVVVLDRLGLDRITVLGDISAPAEPYALTVTQRRVDGDFKSARAPAALAVGNRDAVGNDYEPRQYLSSQLRDSRIALKINPAIE